MVEVSIHNRNKFGWCVRKGGVDVMQFSTKFQAIEYCRANKWFYTIDL
mgnify:FL=1